MGDNYYLPDLESDSFETGRLNNAVVVKEGDSLQTKLNDAVNNSRPVHVTGGGTVTLSSKVSADGDGSAKLSISVDDDTTIKNGGFDDTTLELTNFDRVSISGGEWDMNGANRSDTLGGGGEIVVDGSNHASIGGGIHIFDVQMFAIRLNDTAAVVGDYHIETDQAVGGTDGVHADIQGTTVEHFVVGAGAGETADDSVVATVGSGGRLEQMAVGPSTHDPYSSEDATGSNGVKIHTQTDSSSVGSVNVQGLTIRRGGKRAQIEIRNTDTNTKNIEEVHLNAVLRDSAALGAELRNVQDLTADLTVDNPTTMAAEVADVDNLNLRITGRGVGTDYMVSAARVADGTIRPKGDVEGSALNIAQSDVTVMDPRITGDGGSGDHFAIFYDSDGAVIGGRIDNFDNAVRANGATESIRGLRVSGLKVENVVRGVKTQNDVNHTVVGDCDLRGASSAALALADTTSHTSNNAT